MLVSTEAALTSRHGVTRHDRFTNHPRFSASLALPQLLQLTHTHTTLSLSLLYQSCLYTLCRLSLVTQNAGRERERERKKGPGARSWRGALGHCARTRTRHTHGGGGGGGGGGAGETTAIVRSATARPNASL